MASPQSTASEIASLSSGWYVLIACMTGILLADTRASKIVTPILGLGLIYQLNLMLEGK